MTLVYNLSLKTFYTSTFKLSKNIFRRGHNKTKSTLNCINIGAKKLIEPNQGFSIYKINEKTQFPTKNEFLASPNHRAKIRKDAEIDRANLDKNLEIKILDKNPHPWTHHGLLIRKNPYRLGNFQVVSHYTSKAEFLDYDKKIKSTTFLSLRSWSNKKNGSPYLLYAVEYPEDTIKDRKIEQFDLFVEPNSRHIELSKGQRCTEKEASNYQKFLNRLVARADRIAFKYHLLSIQYRQRVLREAADHKRKGTSPKFKRVKPYGYYNDHNENEGD